MKKSKLKIRNSIFKRKENRDLINFKFLVLNFSFSFGGD